MVEVNESDENTSLLWYGIKYGRKRFYSIGPWKVLWPEKYPTPQTHALLFMLFYRYKSRACTEKLFTVIIKTESWSPANYLDLCLIFLARLEPTQRVSHEY